MHESPCSWGSRNLSFCVVESRSSGVQALNYFEELYRLEFEELWEI